jgi:hypothetical protein
MAKNSMLPMKTGGGMLGKVIGTVVCLAVVALVVKHPADAAGWVTGGLHVAGSVIDGVSTFLAHVLG